MTKIAQGVARVIDWVEKHFPRKRGIMALSFWSANNGKGSFWEWFTHAKEGKKCNNEVAGNLLTILHSGKRV